MNISINFLLAICIRLLPIQDDVNILYKKESPIDKSELTYFKKTGSDYTDRAEKILKDVEFELLAYAKKKNAGTIEIFIIGQQHGELPTESQKGKKGFVEILFSLKNYR
jgi:hypothetical protein